MAVDLPDGVLQAYFSAGLQDYDRRNKDTDLATGRARDTALHGLKTIEAVTAYELLVSNDANERARMNAAARVPTTLDHPGIPVAK